MTNKEIQKFKKSYLWFFRKPKPRYYCRAIRQIIDKDIAAAHINQITAEVTAGWGVNDFETFDSDFYHSFSGLSQIYRP